MVYCAEVYLAGNSAFLHDCAVYRLDSAATHENGCAVSAMPYGKVALRNWRPRWGYPDSVDSDEGLEVVSVRAAMYCCT